MNGKHLLKAEPLNAILDPQYFVRQVHECVMRVLSDRMAKEQQSADQAARFRSAFMTTAWPPLLAWLPRLSTAPCAVAEHAVLRAVHVIETTTGLPDMCESKEQNQEDRVAIKMRVSSMLILPILSALCVSRFAISLVILIHTRTSMQISCREPNSS